MSNTPTLNRRPWPETDEAPFQPDRCRSHATQLQNSFHTVDRHHDEVARLQHAAIPEQGMKSTNIARPWRVTRGLVRAPEGKSIQPFLNGRRVQNPDVLFEHPERQLGAISADP